MFIHWNPDPIFVPIWELKPEKQHFKIISGAHTILLSCGGKNTGVEGLFIIYLFTLFEF